MRGVAYSPAERELLMKMHQQGKSLSVLSRETGIARPVLSRWWVRYQREGRAGLEPRSRRPNHSPRQLSRGIRSEILELRKRGWGPARIALALGIGHSSVHRVLVRHGHNRLRWPEKKIIRRYEKSRPGELVHLDLKYLYRWKNTQREYAFAGVDDFSREAVAQIRPERSSGDAAAFLERLVSELPYRVEAVMTDNDLIFTMRYAFHSQRQPASSRPVEAWASNTGEYDPGTRNRTAKWSASFAPSMRNALPCTGLALPRPACGSWKNSCGITTMSGLI